MTRFQWDSRLIFIFATIGSAVGLGNLWRFPYFSYQYGGSFLIPYLLVLLFIGFPFLILEFAIGQKFRLTLPAILKKIHPKFEGLGYAAILNSFFISVYYAIIMAWSLLFFLFSFSDALPWKGNAKDFFFHSILNFSNNNYALNEINLALLLSLFAVWVIIYIFISKGYRGFAKSILLTIPLPIFILGFLAIRIIFLEGSFLGIMNYLIPNIDALLDPEIWFAATSQVFFTLSLAAGVMVTYSSYSKNQKGFANNSFVVVATNAIISLLAGFVVFGFIGYLSMVNGTAFYETIQPSAAVSFIVLSEALSLLPWSWFFSILFFLVVLSLGIDSAFSLVETINATLFEKRTRLHIHHITGLLAFSGFILGIIFTFTSGIHHLIIVDRYVSGFGLLLVGLFECIIIGWFYGPDKIRKSYNLINNWKLTDLWDIIIKFLIPLFLIVILIYQIFKDLTYGFLDYPRWSLLIGWSLVLLPLLVILYFFIKNKNPSQS